ncbi:hypothetical protein, partial [Bacillus sp. WP8]|uniref:hypothetical protein n=1 Tax=Bacillus sp. WP8 TaxID=756828 RepID=UPI0037C127B6
TIQLQQHHPSIFHILQGSPMQQIAINIQHPLPNLIPKNKKPTNLTLTQPTKPLTAHKPSKLIHIHQVTHQPLYKPQQQAIIFI